jgi:3-oxoacyl-[acyl-carrier-protein] synthase III
VRIDAVTAVFPSTRVGNEEIVRLVREESQATFTQDLDKALGAILFQLRHSGACERYVSRPDEVPLNLIEKAILGALEEAGCSKEEIEILIYTSIARGFVEPGGAYFVAQALGMDRVHCFDVMDGCMSWSRAADLVQSLFRSGRYRRALIVNGEFILRKGGMIYPHNFALERYEDISWSFPGLTAGEVATATVLSHDADCAWEFCFSARTDLADLCTVPTDGYQDYCRPSARIGKNGIGHFTTFGSEIQSLGAKDLVDVFRRLQTPRDEIRVIFPHSATKTGWDGFAAACGVEDRMFHVYDRCGNVGSASIPTGMALAVKEGRLRRGDRAAAWLASAGMSFAAYSFTY